MTRWRWLLTVLAVLLLADTLLAARFGVACVNGTCLGVEPWGLTLQTMHTQRAPGGGLVTTLAVQRWGWVRGQWVWGGLP